MGYDKDVMTVLEDGTIIGFEVDLKEKNMDYIEGEDVPVSGDIITDAPFPAEKLMKDLGKFSTVLVEELKDSNSSKIEIEFGAKFSVQSGKGIAVIISGSAEANIKVKLTWENSYENANSRKDI